MVICMSAPPHKILHLIDTGGPGGAETIFLELACGLKGPQWGSLAVVPREDWLSDALRRRGCTPIVLGGQRSFDLPYLRKLRSIIVEHEIALVQTHLFGTSVYGTLAAWTGGIPVVSTFHGLPDIPSGGLLVRLKRCILRGKRNHVIFVSESLRDALKWSARPWGNPPAVIPNGVDCSVFWVGRNGALRRELNLDDNVLLLGALGNVRPSKRYDLLLEAFAEVKARMPLAHLVVAGQAKGPLYEGLLGLRSALGLEGSVHFLGFREDVPQVLQGIDLFVLSSGDEGFSLATVQAMATGLPVVATRCGGPEEILEDGVTGRLVSVDDPMSLAEGILEVLSLPDRGEALGKAARERAVSRFSLDTMVRQYEALYRRCLGIAEAEQVGCAGH